MNETPKTSRRILAVQPIACGRQWYWYRDLGLIVRTLREMGHDAWMVLFPSDEGPPDEGQPVIIATKEQLEDPAWWKAQAPDAVIMGFWGATRWEGVRAAARQATSRLFEKLDTAGIYTPEIWWWRYFYVGYGHEIDAGVFAPLAAARIFARSLALQILPGLLDKKRVECMGRVPILAAETPLAVERTKRYLRTFGGKETLVTCLPHPVDAEGDLARAGTDGKQNKIVAVGRWETHQKNFPLLIETLALFLSVHPEWSAEIFGTLPADSAARLATLPAGVVSRITLAGQASHAELARHYGEAKIFFMPSRYESFNIAAAEALCCGCGVVGWAAIASIPFFCGRKSGTPAYGYSAKHFLDALEAEAGAWNAGERDPRAISAEWIGTVGARTIARKMLGLLGFAEK